ncbi:MAG: L,D-transpeptidase [Actinobacteria bacterium]|nr:MAG: L,D-transpeptidase [Actinomycetota bacterium]
MGRRSLTLSTLVLAFIGACALPASTAFGRIAMNGGGTNDWMRVDTPPPANLIASVRPGSVVELRGRPFGRVLERLGSTTPFGSPRALGIVTTRRGRWLAVTDPTLGNGRLGWIDARAGGVHYSRTRLELEVDLSSRTLVVRRDGTTVRRFSVGVGRPGSPTPTGRFAVTDKLDGPAYSAYYGCCILALSATQPNLPAGWTGGNRIAIHGTLSPGDFGRAVSAGCVHAPDAELRYLMRTVPLGTPVVIRA